MIIVGVLNARTSKDLFSKLQRFVTGKNVTHSFLLLDNFYGDYQMLDARSIVTLDPLQRVVNDGVDLWLYKININEENSDIVRTTMYNRFIGKTYGYSQLIWFVWRRFNELLFKRNMKAKSNWFSNGVLCSESVWYTLEHCASIDNSFNNIKNYLKEYNPDSFHSGDCKELLDKLVEDKIIERFYI